MEPADFRAAIGSSECVREGLRDYAYQREFRKALVHATRRAFPRTDRELREAFRALDLDGSGKIEHDEIRSLLLKMDRSFTEEDVAGILGSLDLDARGRIRWEEFRRIFGR
mmetsp:Transcript_3216/g.8692  ORF Transcript_3216/g.8692 Transcript_3216/m.8692 type:complete len:111 (-) Transcript_3216:723-1055(-)